MEVNIRDLMKKKFGPKISEPAVDNSDVNSVLSVASLGSTFSDDLGQQPKKKEKKKKKNKYYKTNRPKSIINISPAFTDDEDSEGSDSETEKESQQPAGETGSSQTPAKIKNKPLSMNMDINASGLSETQKKILAYEHKMLNNLKLETVRREQRTKTKLKVHKSFRMSNKPATTKPKTKTTKKSKKNKRLARMSKKRIQLLDKPPEAKSAEEAVYLKQMLKKHVLFSSLDEEDLNELINAMHKTEVDGGKTYRSTTFAVVAEGEATVTETSAKLKPNSLFFADSLMTQSNTFYTLLNSGTDTLVMYELEGDRYSAILVTANAKRRRANLARLQHIPLLATLDSDIVHDLIDKLQKVEYKQGDKIIEKDTEGAELFIILSGKVKVTNLGGIMQDLELGENDFFGEAALVHNQLRSADIVCASEECELYKLDRDSFEAVLGLSKGAAKNFVARNHQLRLLRTIPLFAGFSDADFEHLMDPEMSEEVEFEGGEKIVTKNKRNEKFFVLLDGSVNVHTNSKDEESADAIVVQKVSDAGEFFGENGLVNEVAFTDVIVEKTTGAKFLAFNVKGLKIMLDSKNDVKQKVEKTFESRRVNTLRHEKLTWNLDDLTQGRTLGTGTFGRVRLVHTKAKNGKPKFYALKIISKTKVVQYEQQQNVYNEKNTLLETTHPFILKLYATFKDDQNLYMLMGLVQGGELFSLLRKLRKKLDGKWYVACMISALSYLHSKRLVYRDIKPENVLIDKDGYVKLVDFGFCKRVKGKTYTMCGTPEYMAVEILLRKGYNRAVDYWAVGICFFEMCFGYTPFGYNGTGSGGQGNYIEICKNIVRNNFKYPQLNPRVMNRMASSARMERERQYSARKRFIKGLMRRDPSQRYGMGRDGVKKLKEEEVFEGLDWEMLYTRQLSAPWVPSLKNEQDTNYFMKYPEEEEEDEYEDDGTGWDAEF